MAGSITYRLQPNAWSCGPTALYNALKARGVRCSVQTLSDMAGCTRAKGIGYEGLKGAATWYGWDLAETSCYEHEFARACVRNCSPMLVCVDRDSDGPYAHWITVLRATKRHVWIADPARPGPCERRLTWRAFLARAVAVLGPGEHKYTFHPLSKRKNG